MKRMAPYGSEGFCLSYKALEKGRFPWPSPVDGVARLTVAQLAMLLDGIDWRRPSRNAPPGRICLTILLIPRDNAVSGGRG
ncbi:IS66 family insertion sequence element accessory protein TnpB [Amaricoccus sp. W119]|uniref:IS66 family insertion sequence element accessory protein TnpB n=1 Tax=Amaricoccus sp. W119 TaxID=3391833 RepID=UPI0039A43998